jgi:drug/metabolite transporter (DMT)-like permease
MTPMVMAVVLGSAVLHAVWNALAHTSKDRLAAITLIAAAAGICCAILLPFLPTPNHVVWPYIAASTVLEVVYSFGLVLAYRLGEFGRMYPIARGTSPLVVALVATFVLGQPMSPSKRSAWPWSARACSPSPCPTACPSGRTCPRSSRPSAPAARSRATPSWTAWPCARRAPCSATPAGSSSARRSSSCASPPPSAAAPSSARCASGTAKGLGGGVISLTAYTLVLWAQTKGNLAEVATLRETSILIGAAIGALVLKEGFGRIRIAASAGVVLGILLIAH